jgi:uncharacterized membrane protein
MVYASLTSQNKSGGMGLNGLFGTIAATRQQLFHPFRHTSEAT